MIGATGRYRRSRLNPVPILVVLVVWEVAARWSIVNPAFVPPPTQIATTIGMLAVYDDLLFHVWTSLRRVVLAFTLGASTGIAAGLLMGWSRDVRLILNPYVGFLYPLPKIVLLPIMFSIFGVTELARVLTMSLAVFLLVAIYSMSSISSIDEVQIDVALDNGADSIDLFREVIIPGALPQIFSGLSVGFGLCFTLIVVIEMVAAGNGLGYLIWSSWELFRIPRLYAALISINVIGFVSLYGIAEIRQFLTPWVVDE